MEPHQHHAGCGCAEEHKKTDPHGNDLYPHIILDSLDCFNEKINGSLRRIVRPVDKKLIYSEDDIVWSAYGKDLVMFFPFNGEIKIKAICVIGGDESSAPSRMKLYKDVEAVDISILEDKKPIQIIDLN